MTALVEVPVDKVLLSGQELASIDNISAPPASGEHHDEKAGFIRKVLGLVTIQICVTFISSIISSANHNFGEFCQHPVTLLLAIVGYIVGAILSICLGRKVPWNYIGLWLFTISMSLWVSAITAGIELPIVVAAVVITMIMAVGLCVFALMASKEELLHYLLFVLCLWVVEFIVALFVFAGQSWAEPFYCSLAALIYGAYVVIDVYRLKEITSIDDYIPAAILIYIDLIRIFLYILAALSKKKK